MKKFSVKEFSEVFEAIGIEQGDNLLVHNSLLSFGIPNDAKIGEVPSAIYEHLYNRIGPAGTIAVPAFNFDFCNGITFNRQETPSKSMGVFSEYVRKLPDAKRSFHPMQSIAVVGKNAEYITENDTESSFSEDGPFDRLNKLKGKILLLGADFNTVSMIHLLEEKLFVPYRYWKDFTGPYIENGETSERSYKMFVRSLEMNPLLKLYSIEKELKKNNKLREAKVGGGIIKVFKIEDFLEVAESMIENNLYYFVSNNPEFEKLADIVMK